jgi:hypothetical protein
MADQGLAKSPLNRPAPAEKRRRRSPPRGRAEESKLESLQKTHSPGAVRIAGGKAACLM